MTGVGDDSRDRSASKPWLVVGFLLAIGATLALVLTDDLRWVRLAVVAALWAALIGALMAAKYRKQAVFSEKSATKAQKIYELELEKEVAARHEHELEIEAEARQRVEAESRDELEALREELRSLRENLQNLFGGEVLWERVALTAQSTRMRKVGEEPRLVTAGEAPNGQPALTVSAEADEPDPPTELIGRIRDLDADRDEAEEPLVPRAEQPRRRDPGTRARLVPRPSRPAEDSRPGQQPVDPPTRRVQPKTGSAMARASEAAKGARAELSRPYQRPVGNPNGMPPAKPYAPRRTGEPHGTPAERSRPAVAPVPTEGRGRPPGDGQQPGAVRRERHPAVEDTPTRTQRPVDPRTAVSRPVNSRAAQRPGRALPPEPNQPTETPRPPYAAPAGPGAAEPAAEATMEAAVPETVASPPTRPDPNPTLPPEIRDANPGGHRRRAEPDDVQEAAPSSGGGRRRRPDDEEPSWMAGRAGGGRRRAAEEGAESAPDAASGGSHSAGRSVSELLAAHGASSTTPRRRRRAAD